MKNKNSNNKNSSNKSFKNQSKAATKNQPTDTKNGNGKNKQSENETITSKNELAKTNPKADKKNHKTAYVADKFRLGITIGDLNGIGIEVIVKTFSDSRMLEHCIPVIYGSSRAISYHRKVLKADDFTYHITNNISRLKPSICNVLNCWTEEVQITIGRPNPKIGRYALRAIESAAYDISQGKLDAIITAPVNKKLLNTDKMHFSGHTEYFAEKFQVDENLMFLVSDTLRVGLATNHLPIKDVANAITKDLVLKKIKLMAHSLQQDFGIMRPKIAVMGLNPHAGDDGLIGKEEETAIIPAIEAAKADNLLTFGPYAADGFFGSNMYRQFDGILAMYHDQGLVAFKALSFGHGVNFTAGMPVVRTSPDHGTAYDIAGKNIASESSFRNAVYLAMDIIRNRKQFAEITANPLDKESLLEDIESEGRRK